MVNEDNIGGNEKTKEKPIDEQKDEGKKSISETDVIIRTIIVLLVIFIIAGFAIKVPYTIQEPYSEKVPLLYKVENANTHSCGSIFNYMLCLSVSVENIDSEGGTFYVNCNFKGLHRTLTGSDSSYIGPGQTKTLTCKSDTNWGEDIDTTYRITPGTKTVTGYRTVRKYHSLFAEWFG